MTALPIILTVGVNKSKCEDLIENEPIKCRYNLRIDNKYYSADVQFHVLNDKTSSFENIKNCVEAIMLYVDHSIDMLEEEINKCNFVISDIDADIKILIFKHSIPEDQKNSVHDWCCKKEYEFIELEVNEDIDTDPTSENKETFGIHRVIEALETHQWSNLHLKKKVTHDNTNAGSTCDTLGKDTVTTTIKKDEKKAENSENSVITNGQLDNMEELFDLFQNLQSMKLNMSSLSGTEKLDQAEKVVKAFWSAIGGDVNEFSDSDDKVT